MNRKVYNRITGRFRVITYQANEAFNLRFPEVWEAAEGDHHTKWEGETQVSSKVKPGEFVAEMIEQGWWKASPHIQGDADWFPQDVARYWMEKRVGGQLVCICFGQDHGNGVNVISWGFA